MKTGVKAKNSSARKGVVGSVENSLEKYIGFDKEGFVFFNEGASCLVEKYPKSNFALLFSLNLLVLASGETLEVMGLPVNKKTKDYDMSLRDFILTVDYTGRSPIFGIFLAGESRGTSLPVSADGISRVYFATDKNLYDPGWVAHELFLHALAYYRGFNNWGHSNPAIGLHKTVFNNARRRKP